MPYFRGARHGLKLSGKLARIEAQEQELLEKLKQIREQPSTSKGVPLQNEVGLNTKVYISNFSFLLHVTFFLPC